jgi:hypothetical protein
MCKKDPVDESSDHRAIEIIGQSSQSADVQERGVVKQIAKCESSENGERKIPWQGTFAAEEEKWYEQYHAYHKEAYKHGVLRWSILQK